MVTIYLVKNRWLGAAAPGELPGEKIKQTDNVKKANMQSKIF